MPSVFFGDLSPFQIIVSIVALSTGAYTLYTAFAKAKLRLFLSDSVSLVVPPRQATEKFHIGCNLVNPSAKVSTLHRLEATILDPEKRLRHFDWNLFFEYGPGGNHLQKTSDPFALAVNPRNSLMQFIEFKLVSDEEIDHWPVGRYEFTIIGWANRRNRKSRPNLEATFHIDIDQVSSMTLSGTEQSNDVAFRFPIVEWGRTMKC